MAQLFSADEWKTLRLDVGRIIILALLSCLIWCTAYNRWTVQSWETPINYISGDIDVPIMLAWIKAAGDGHLFPLCYSMVPELGAPYVANWNDFPVTEKLLLCATGGLYRIVGLFAAANLAVMMGQVLAAVSFYVACRLVHASWIWSFAGGIAFGFSRFAFAHELHHFIVMFYWYVPLAMVVVEWIASGEGLKLGERRFYFALIVAFITGAHHIYYTNLFIQFIVLAGFVHGWRCGWTKAVPAMAILDATLAGGFLMNINTIVYQLTHGWNAGAIVRTYYCVELFGLKLVDLVVPPPEHRLPVFAQWAAHHLGETFLSWGEMPPTAYVGLVGLAAMVWLAAVSFRRVMNNVPLPFEFWLIFWIFLSGGVGGINGTLATIGYVLFRATTRYSIFVLCVLLMFAVRRLSLIDFRSPFLAYGAAILATGIALWDQVPPIVSSQAILARAQDVASDREFTRKMEDRLPPNAMVFQIPVIDFPEGAGIPGSGPYDHFRPYFFAHHLHFSFGANKGRSRDAWQQALMLTPPENVISQLERYGFAAIYINQIGYPDHGAAFLDALKKTGHTEVIENDRGTLACVILKPSAHPVLPDAP
jgi:phosphoglycerol transferase